MANNFVANAGFLKVYWSLAGQLGINVYGVRIPSGVTITPALTATVAAAVKASYTTNLAPLQSSNCAIVRVGLRDYRTPNQPEFRDTASAAGGVEPSGQTLPIGTAICITLRTALSGKSFRGRSYIPGFSETQNGANGAVVTAAANASVTYVNGIKNALSASGMFLAIVSRPSDRHVLSRTTYHPDGTTTIDTLSDESARIGGVTDVDVIESRTPNWEYQRRRDNQRGQVLTLLSPVSSNVLLGLT